MGVKFYKQISAKLSYFKEVKFPCCNENRSRRTIKINILRFKKSPRLHKQAERLQGGEKNMSTFVKKDVDLWFENQLTPTLHKPVRYRFKRNKTFVKGVGEQFQSDLSDMSNISKFNDKYTFLLTCIDRFSRYAWVKPVKNKSGLEIARVLEEIFAGNSVHTIANG